MTKTMERQFFSGNTIEQAVLAAARHYGLEPERVAYTLREKKHGFVNIRRRVVIEVDPEAPELPEGAAPTRAGAEEARPRPAAPSAGAAHDRPQPRAARRREDPPPASHGPAWSGPTWRGSRVPRVAEDVPDREEAAVEMALEEIVALLDLELEISIRRGEEGLEVELSGEDGDALRAREGALLDAIEHLLPRMVRGLVGRAVPCQLDSGGYRAAHRREMQSLAERMADEVRRDGQSQILEPMSPADRRLVHLALAEDPTVRTEIEGGGFMKRVRISPA